MSKPTDDKHESGAVGDARRNPDGNPGSYVGTNEPDDALDAEETGAEARTDRQGRPGR